MKGNITNTGYWPNSPDRNNDYNIIPSNEITMEGMNIPLIGISNTGDIRVMRPNENHKFNGDYVTEFPIRNQNDPGWGVQTTPTYPSKYPLDPGFDRSTPSKPNQQAIDEWEKIVNAGKNDFLKRVPTSNDPLFNELKRRNENMNRPIFLGKYKFANGGLVKMQDAGTPPKNPELAKFSKQPVNTNDLRYVGSQQAVQDNTRVVVPNVQAAKKEAPAVQNEIQRVNKSIESRNSPYVRSAADVYAVEENERYQPPQGQGYVAKQVPGVLGSMMTIYVNPAGEQWVDPRTVAQQQASMAMKDDADMLFNRLNPLTATGAMTFYGADNVAKGNVVGGLAEMAMASPLAGKLIHGAGHYGLDKGLISEAVVPTLNKRLHQAYEVKHTAATVKAAGDRPGLPVEQAKEYVYKPEFIDSDTTRQNKEYMQKVYGQLPTTPFWMPQQTGPRMMNGGDISVPDLRRVKIKSLPRSWKSQ